MGEPPVDPSRQRDSIDLCKLSVTSDFVQSNGSSHGIRFRCGWVVQKHFLAPSSKSDDRGSGDVSLRETLGDPIVITISVGSFEIRSNAAF